LRLFVEFFERWIIDEVNAPKNASGLSCRLSFLRFRLALGLSFVLRASEFLDR
jgi:hypothetical protein